MEPLHARYPFLARSREAVEAAAVDLGEIVATDETVTARALERVESAITDGTVGEPHRRTRVELLSYPVARVLVSLVDVHICTRKYAQAEAEAAYDRFTEEFATTTELKSTQRETLDRTNCSGSSTLQALSATLATGTDVEVGAYLDLAADQRGDS